VSGYFDQLVEAHGEIVMRVLVSLLGRHDAQDCWQETFIAALKTYDRVELTNPRGWLLTIAHRKAIDMARAGTRRRVLTELTEFDDGIDQSGSAVEDPSALIINTLGDADLLRPALDALPPKQRLAVVYRYIGDLPYDEIACLLECSQPAARRSVFEGLRNLRHHLTTAQPINADHATGRSKP
jgi:RNA polymerase sigma factor (sigma-70 family)